MNYITVLFIGFAALGCFILFSFHVRKKPIPGRLIPIHGAGALAAFALLQIAVFR
ncbi:MAG TPA: hypothetical protein PKN50_05460 [Spirochaetota bacterium]|nr:hypothetical protein [Spirochaetota bacterium]HPV39713.1 hypothetical protein [Spirochaetota bacterium]